jgi:hypothetical protein
MQSCCSCCINPKPSAWNQNRWRQNLICGVQTEYVFLDDERVMLKYVLPLSEIVTGFYDELKSRSSGYGTPYLSSEIAT